MRLSWDRSSLRASRATAITSQSDSHIRLLIGNFGGPPDAQSQGRFFINSHLLSNFLLWKWQTLQELGGLKNGLNLVGMGPEVPKNWKILVGSFPPPPTQDSGDDSYWVGGGSKIYGWSPYPSSHIKWSLGSLTIKKKQKSFTFLLASYTKIDLWAGKHEKNLTDVICFLLQAPPWYSTTVYLFVYLLTPQKII